MNTVLYIIEKRVSAIVYWFFGSIDGRISRPRSIFQQTARARLDGIFFVFLTNGAAPAFNSDKSYKNRIETET